MVSLWKKIFILFLALFGEFSNDKKYTLSILFSACLRPWSCVANYAGASVFYSVYFSTIF
jgi:hypothetical protein